MSDPDERVQGVDFGDLADDLADVEYPATAAELTASFGDRTLGLPKGETTLGAVLDRYEGEAFDDAESVQTAVTGLVGEEAVGREGYSDRGAGAEESGEETL